MADPVYRIGQNRVTDPTLVAALKESAQKQGYPEKTSFSENDLVNILDVFDGGKSKGSIDPADLIQASVIDRSLSESSFRRLATAFGRHFPESKTKLNMALIAPSDTSGARRFVRKRSAQNSVERTIGSRVATLEPEHKVSLGEAVSELLGRSDILFVGDSHAVEDEASLLPLVARMKTDGVKQLAVEFDSKNQKELDEFLETGDPSVLPHPFDRVVQYEKGLVALMQAFKSAGMNVVAIDDHRAPHSPREQHMADKLAQLPGKTVAVVGGAHAALDFSPPNARIRLEGRKTTTGIKLESRAGIDILAKQWRPQAAARAFSAYDSNFPNGAPAKSFAYPTNQMAGARYYDPTPVRGVSPWLSYKKTFDYVFLLSEADSKPVSLD